MYSQSIGSAETEMAETEMDYFDSSKRIIVKYGRNCKPPRCIKAPIPATSKKELESGEDLFLYQVSDESFDTGTFSFN